MDRVTARGGSAQTYQWQAKPPAPPRRQFRVLLRHFLTRIFDLELLSARSDLGRLLAQLTAALAAFSFTVTVMFAPRFATSQAPHDSLLPWAWNDVEFLISTTMTVAGLFTVLAWNSVFPDRRDSLVLGVLPLRTRVMVLAKVAAISSALCMSIAASNIFTGICYPFIVTPSNGGILAALRALGAYWLSVAAAGVFVCGSLLALQGLAAQLLSYRRFLRLSGFLQTASLFVIVGIYFLEPALPAAPRLRAMLTAGPLSWLPSFWFFGLFQQLTNANDPAFVPLAPRALGGLAVALSISAATFALAWRRSVHHIIEQPDIAPSDRSRPAARIAAALVRRIFSRPLDRAILLFTARGIARSRQHRLLLSVYGGIALAVALVYAKDLLYGISGSVWDLTNVRPRPNLHWNQPNVPFLVGSLVLLSFAIIGIRSIFALPIALPANWVFRITAVHRPGAYFEAVRRSLYALTILPVVLAAAVIFFAIWPRWAALEHIAILCLIGVLLVETAVCRFRKIPFACSYLPGKANIHVKLGIWGILFLLIADRGVAIESWAMERPTRFLVLFVILLAAAVWARRRTSESTRARHVDIQFDDQPQSEVNPLDLSSDAAWLGDAEPPLSHAASVLWGGRPRPRPTPSSASVIPSQPNNPDERVRRGSGEPPHKLLSISGETLRSGFRWDQVMRDVRSGSRILTRSPGFSAAAIALIAIGIGGNTTIYSIIHAILTRPAPGVEAQNLVAFGLSIDGHPAEPIDSALNYVDYAAQTKTMDALVAIRGARFTLTLPDGSYELRAQAVTQNYFDALKVRIVKGRGFTTDEATGASGLAAVIAHHVWQNQFHGADNIIGRPILLSGHPATVVGVGPPGFRGTQFAPNLEICVPMVAYMRMLRLEPEFLNRSLPALSILGRLKPGVSLVQARAEFEAISRRLQRAYPDADKGRVVILAPYSATAMGPWQSAQAHVFMSLITVVALLALLVVCANVANLMLARSVARQREMAVRRSLGATRLRILRLHFIEGLYLSLAAWAAACLFAVWACRAIVKLIPPLASGARLEPDLAPDWRVAVYAIVLAALSALAFTLVPALRAGRLEVLPWLKAGEGGIAQGRSRLAGALVILQLALCVLLLTGAGLASRSIFLISKLDLHFAKDHLLLVDINTSGAASSEAENIALLERLRERLRGLPGVIDVAWATAVPPSNFGGWMQPVRSSAASRPFEAAGMDVGPRFLGTLRVPSLVGRDISREDVASARRCAVINRNLADALWPGQSALGRSMLLGRESVEVVGVAPNGAFAGVDPGARTNFVFLAEDSADGPGRRFLHVRYAGSLAMIGPAVRAAIRDTDSRIAASNMRTMETELEEYSAPAIVIASLLGLFSTGTLIVAAIGLYAVIAFHAARRTRDFGVRIALGATSSQILQTVLREGLLLALAGCVLGFALSAAVARALASRLPGVTPTDAPTFLGVFGLLALVSLAACMIPARRAARTDPMQALRQE